MILIFDYEFSSAHFYEQKKWSPEKNRLVFGRCYTPHGHGHNYRLQTEIEIGDQEPKGAKERISDLLRPVVSALDHEHLNHVIPYFKDHVPTTENISRYLLGQIRLPDEFQLKTLRLFEMDSIFVEFKV